jgi:hypothetical protein
VLLQDFECPVLGMPYRAAPMKLQVQPILYCHGRRVLACHCRRVMLKISGEALQGDLGFGIDPEARVDFPVRL